MVEVPGFVGGISFDVKGMMVFSLERRVHNKVCHIPTSGALFH